MFKTHLDEESCLSFFVEDSLRVHSLCFGWKRHMEGFITYALCSVAVLDVCLCC